MTLVLADGPPLAGFLAQLLDDMAVLLDRLPIAKTVRPQFLLLERNGRLECLRRRRGRFVSMAQGSWAEIGRGKLLRTLRKGAVELRLDESKALTRIVRLPEAGREHLKPIVLHQVERLTPWTLDNVVFDLAVVENDGSREIGEIAVRLVATSRAMFEASLSEIRASGVEPMVVGLSSDPIDRPSPVNLASSARSARMRKARHMAAAFFAVTVGIAWIGCALSSWENLRLQAEFVARSEEVNMLRTAVGRLEANLDAAAQSDRALERKRRMRPMVLLVEELSSLIPETSYLTDLSAEGATVRLSGLAADAPGLIGILDRSEMLADVHFAAPVIKDPQGARDHFEIEASIQELVAQ